MNYYKLLSEEPLFWSRMGWCGDYSEPDADGKRVPVYEEKDWTVSEREVRAFFEAGCRLYTSNIHNGWIGIDTYDYTAVDETLEAYCGFSPEAFYMPRIRLDAPRDWCIANPGELSLTESGPKDPAEIQRIFSDCVDLKEYNAYRSGGGGRRGFHLNSFSSGKWLHDATEALRRVIEHIENSKYGRQIVGYHLTFGMCGETCNWGAWEGPEFWGDFSTVNAKAFYDYCIKYYGSKEKAEAALGINAINYDNILPPISERCVLAKDVSEYFRSGQERAIRYSAFLSDRVTDNICYFAKIAKEIVPDKPIGFFYGYIMSRYPGELGHLFIQKLLDSPYVDFLSTPKSYYRYGVGESGGSQSASMSVSRKKLWLDELDNDTHLAKKCQVESAKAQNMAETRAILWREVAKNLAWNNQNFWWMDLHGGWFCDDEIMDEISGLVEFNRKMRARERHSISEILLITDENTLLYQTADQAMMGSANKGIVNEIWSELRLCGAPVDEYRMSDLKDLDITGYKMIVFANAFTVDEEIRGIIANIPESTLCVWNYAAGIRNPDFGLEHTKELTGMVIADYERDYTLSNGYGAPCTCPPIQIIPEDGVMVLERYEDGAVKTARKNNSLLVASPNLRAEDFHRLAKEQGVHMYTDAGCTVYADSRFVGIFSGMKAVSGIRFPKEGTYVDVLSGSRYENENNNEIPPKCALIFELKNMDF